MGVRRNLDTNFDRKRDRDRIPDVDGDAGLKFDISRDFDRNLDIECTRDTASHFDPEAGLTSVAWPTVLPTQPHRRTASNKTIRIASSK